MKLNIYFLFKDDHHILVKLSMNKFVSKYSFHSTQNGALVFLKCLPLINNPAIYDIPMNVEALSFMILSPCRNRYTFDYFQGEWTKSCEAYGVSKDDSVKPIPIEYAPFIRVEPWESQKDKPKRLRQDYISNVYVSKQEMNHIETWTKPGPDNEFSDDGLDVIKRWLRKHSTAKKIIDYTESMITKEIVIKPKMLPKPHDKVKNLWTGGPQLIIRCEKESDEWCSDRDLILMWDNSYICGHKIQQNFIDESYTH